MARRLSRRRHARRRVWSRTSETSGAAGFFVDADARIGHENVEEVFDQIHLVEGEDDIVGDRTNQFTYEDLIAADNRNDIGLFIPTDDQVIDFNGTDERLVQSAPAVSLNFGNVFTWMCSIKPTSDGGWVMGVSGVALTEQIRVLNSSGKDYRVLLGLNNKDYNAPNVLTLGTWNSLSFTWDGTNLLIYVNGAPISPTKISDNALTRADTALRVAFASSVDGASAHAGARMHSSAFWSTVLTAPELVAIHKNGDVGNSDLKMNLGDYTSAASLVQWWRFGLGGVSQLGANEIETGVNVGGAAVNIDGTDIFTELPS